ncbi:putative inactive receptor kinase [Apostasia shenzhenica]|uniref:Putative inactive receptor kinase n=1 Tax=Apostasia shenzhenica TaxID=1088818 RepID=A0A2I0B5H9_9ASPA|nr:putative inactive receptor kinase [Apostasia shenzhenica]
MAKATSHLLSLHLVFLLLFFSAKSEEEEVIRLSLISFLQKLSPGDPKLAGELGWTAASDPCLGSWRGVSCVKGTQSVRSIVLDSLRLNGSIDAELLCRPSLLAVVSLRDNFLAGNLPPAIAQCSRLTQLYLSNNHLSGSLPSSLSQLHSLKRLVISGNSFSGELPPELSTIPGLVTFLADRNNFTGPISDFDLANLQQLNVSFNQLAGPLPENSGKFDQSNFAGNPGLCGDPLPEKCTPPPAKPKPKKLSLRKAIMVSAYVLLGLTFVLFLLCKVVRKQKKNSTDSLPSHKIDDKMQFWIPRPTKDFSISSATKSASVMSNSLVVLNPVRGEDLRLEELLRAPAQQLGRGRFGSLYKVETSGGAELVVKRIKDWSVTKEDFERKMEKMSRERHPNILPVTAFYCSNQEKLVVYQYQKNGSLFTLLHENRDGQSFTWASRLNVMAGVSSGVAFLHQSPAGGAVTHGNLKSSNILLSDSMTPLISECGLTSHNSSPSVAGAGDQSPPTDVRALGIIFLELLTGKSSRGFDLVQWVNSVVREEWTVEVFDRALLADSEADDGSEGRMVRLLKVALRCIDLSPAARPTAAQVAAMVEELREEEERSVAFAGA